MRARIYNPTKTVMQSGPGHDKWVLEYSPKHKMQEIDSVMGWTSSNDMEQELRMYFPSQKEAENFAKKNNIGYEIITPKERKVKKKSYADNFKW